MYDRTERDGSFEVVTSPIGSMLDLESVRLLHQAGRGGTFSFPIHIGMSGALTQNMKETRNLHVWRIFSPICSENEVKVLVIFPIPFYYHIP